MKHWYWSLILLAGCGRSSVSPPYTPPPITCTAYLAWVLPTENVYGWPLLVDELDYAVLYMTKIPMVEVADAQMQIDDAYVLATTVEMDEGTSYYRLTVTNDEGTESDFSNEVTKTCP